MPLEYSIASLDTIAPERHELYVERDGAYYLDLDADAVLTVHAPALKKALETERACNKMIKSFGRSPAEIAAIIANAEAVSGKANDMDTTIQQREAAWALEKTELEGRIDASRKSETRIVRDVLLQTGLERAKATTEGISLLKDQLIDRVRLEIDGDNHSLTILSEDGTPRLNADGKPATFADLMADATKAYPGLFQGSGAGGGGKQPNGKEAGGAGDKIITRAELAALPVQEHAAKLKTHTLID